MRDTVNVEFAQPVRHRRRLGAAAALGIIVIGLGIASLSAAGETNANALQTREAARTVRTNQWIGERGLNVNSSADMMKALILACDELRGRGERC